MWHLTRDRVLIVTAAVMTVVAGTMTVLYLTKSEPSAPQVVAPQRWPSPEPTRSTGKSTTKGAVKAGYAIRNTWKDGFNAEVTVTNLGAQPMEGWTVQLELPKTVDVTSIWGAKADRDGGRLILRSQAWNTYLDAGGSIRMGFEAKGAPVQPAGCSVNGSPC